MAHAIWTQNSEAAAQWSRRPPSSTQRGHPQHFPMPSCGGTEAADSAQTGSREQSICSPGAEDSDLPWPRCSRGNATQAALHGAETPLHGPPDHLPPLLQDCTAWALPRTSGMIPKLGDPPSSKPCTRPEPVAGVSVEKLALQPGPTWQKSGLPASGCMLLLSCFSPALCPLGHGEDTASPGLWRTTEVMSTARSPGRVPAQTSVAKPVLVLFKAPAPLEPNPSSALTSSVTLEPPAALGVSGDGLT